MGEKVTTTRAAESLPTMADDFDDELPQTGVPAGDPDSSEFRDALNVVPNRLGVQTLLEQEVDLQEQEAERATLDALEAMRALDHGETVKWRITRTGCDEEIYNGYLETWFNSQMTIERIKKKLGGGTYYLKGFRNGRYFTHKTVVVAGLPLVKPGESSSTAPTPDHGFDVQSFLAQQQAHDERRRREQDERDERRRRERLELLTVLGPLLAPALANLFGNRGPDLGQLIVALKPPDPMQQLAALKALIPEPAPPPPSALESALTLVEKFKEMGALGGDQGTDWMDVLKEAVKYAGPGLAGAMETVVHNAQMARQNGGGAGVSAAGASGPPMLPMPASSPPAVPVTAPAPAGTEDTAMLALLKHLSFLRGQLNRWVVAAHKQAPPEVCAQMFFIDAPADMEPEPLMMLLASPDWFEQLCRVDRRCTQYHSWFSAMRECLIATLRLEYLGEVSAGGTATAGTVAQSEALTGSAASGGAVPSAVPRASRQVGPDGVDRPMRLPSLTGDP